MPKSLILWAASRAAATITVCQALKDRMVLRNGVDLELFRPLDRVKCRERFRVNCPTLLSVGHLIERKGHHLVIEALQKLPEFVLLVAGDGEMQKELETLVKRCGLSDRVVFLGALSQAELVEAYNAADILVLASSREGWANVLLESMACGTPVVATRIWGTPEVVQSAEAGRLVDQRTAVDIATEVRALFNKYPDRRDTRRYAEHFSWDTTVEGCQRIFESVIDVPQMEAIL